MYVARSREDGKFQDLEEHLRETAKRTAEFASAFGAEAWGREIGACHDIGKTSKEFQDHIKDQGPPTDHSTAGAQWILKRCSPIGAYCVAGHHGRLPDGGSQLDTSQMPTLAGRLKRRVPVYDARALENLCSRDSLQLPFSTQFKDREEGGMRLALFTRMLASCLVDADRLDAATFDAGGMLQALPYDGMDALYERLDAHMEKLRNAPPDPNPRRRELNRVRGEIQAECLARAVELPGLFTLTVPTGGGKTLASLAFALAHIRAHAKEYGLRRIFYMLPYTSIIEQNADVYRKLLGAANVLEHHSNARPAVEEFKDADPDDRKSAAWQRAAENWDAPLVVTTNVQFFESLFSAHSSRLRKLHNLARSVLILDEAQMIPQDFLRPCVAVLSELVQSYGCTVVLMSATQPALRPFFGSLRPRELISEPTALHRALRRTHIETLGELEEADLAERLRGHGQVLCIVNSRPHAQALFKALPPEGAFHLSTLMYPNHRRAVLTRIRKRLDAGLPCRIVSTSLIEAGVDLSVPVVYREEAGLDSILQAAGRCNREAKATWEESPVYVFRLAGSRLDAARKQAVFSAHGVLEQFEDPGSPEAVEAYFRQVYGLRGKLLDTKDILALTAEGVERLSIAFRKIEEEFRLIDDRMYDVAIACCPAARDWVRQIETFGPSRERMRALGAYTAQVHPTHLRALQAAGAVRLLGEDTWVMEQPSQYDPHMGLKLEVETGMGLFIEE